MIKCDFMQDAKNSENCTFRFQKMHFSFPRLYNDEKVCIFAAEDNQRETSRLYET